MPVENPKTGTHTRLFCITVILKPFHKYRCTTTQIHCSNMSLTDTVQVYLWISTKKALSHCSALHSVTTTGSASSSSETRHSHGKNCGKLREMVCSLPSLFQLWKISGSRNIVTIKLWKTHLYRHNITIDRKNMTINLWKTQCYRNIVTIKPCFS